MGLRIKPATLSDWWDKETTSNISFSNTTSFAEVTIIVKDKDWKTHQWRTACQEHKNSPRRPGNRKEWHHAGLLLHLCMTATCDWPAVAGLCVHTTSTVAPPQPRSAFSIECTGIRAIKNTNRPSLMKGRTCDESKDGQKCILPLPKN